MKSFVKNGSLSVFFALVCVTNMYAGESKRETLQEILDEFNYRKMDETWLGLVKGFLQAIKLRRDNKDIGTPEFDSRISAAVSVSVESNEKLDFPQIDNKHFGDRWGELNTLSLAAGVGTVCYAAVYSLPYAIQGALKAGSRGAWENSKASLHTVLFGITFAVGLQIFDNFYCGTEWGKRDNYSRVLQKAREVFQRVKEEKISHE